MTIGTTATAMSRKSKSFLRECLVTAAEAAILSSSVAGLFGGAAVLLQRFAMAHLTVLPVPEP